MCNNNGRKQKRRKSGVKNSVKIIFLPLFEKNKEVLEQFIFKYDCKGEFKFKES